MRALCFASILFTSLLEARPLVVGYERFHKDEPTAEGGALLYAELGCANCHGGAGGRSGPSLVDLSKRARHDWVQAFLSDPEHGRAGSPMPSLFDRNPENEHGLLVGDVVAYLGTLEGKTKIKRGRHVNAERGSALYHEIGCVACHAPTPDFKPASPEATGPEDPVALPDLGRKTSLNELADFLLKTEAYRPSGRMPKFPIEEQDALDIAAHLLDFQGSDPREVPAIPKWPKAAAEAVERGKNLVTELRCASCHDLPGLEKPAILPLPSKRENEGNCLTTFPLLGLPNYRLAPDQIAALEAFLAKGDTAASPVPLALEGLNCLACHARDEIGGPDNGTAPLFHGDPSLGDAGRLPPPLTGIGKKLRRDWLEGVLSGRPETRVRPYLKTRMPIYKPQAAHLLGVLAEPQHQPAPDQPELLEAGRKLAGIHGGVNCITCHRWGDRDSLGIQAMDISALDRRLRPEWFRTYLLDPATYRPGTLMPPLWPGGKSSVSDVLGGDTDRQIAALWEFIKNGEGLPEGFPDRTEGRFELVPKDRPIIQRTFLEGVGTKAILVGFPGGLNLAYDAEKARPALLWRGRFFDAYETWFLRKMPMQKPPGEGIQKIPESGQPGRFLGYRIDDKGIPTFLSERAGIRVEETFTAEEGELVQTIKIGEGTPERRVLK